MEKSAIIKKAEIITRRVLRDEKFEWIGELTAEEVNGWDSLSHMIIITEIEDKFGIKFKLKELNKMNIKL